MSYRETSFDAEHVPGSYRCKWKGRRLEMDMNSPTEMLEAEHRVIAKVIGAVPVLADRLDAGQAVDVDLLRALVEFMRTYADQCHHGKEEELLFPALGKRGVPLQGCPVGALTAEHARGRTLVNDLADAIGTHQNGTRAEDRRSSTRFGASRHCI